MTLNTCGSVDWIKICWNSEISHPWWFQTEQEFLTLWFTKHSILLLGDSLKPNRIKMACLGCSELLEWRQSMQSVRVQLLTFDFGPNTNYCRVVIHIPYTSQGVNSRSFDVWIGHFWYIKPIFGSICNCSSPGVTIIPWGLSCDLPSGNFFKYHYSHDACILFKGQEEWCNTKYALYCYLDPLFKSMISAASTCN